MKQLSRTKVTVRIRKAVFRNEWYLCIESYPVFVPGKKTPQRIREYINRSITTVEWDKKRAARTNTDGSKTYKPKRNDNGVIICRSETDQETMLYADGVRKLRQREYDNAGLYSDTETAQAEQKERSLQSFIAYFTETLKKRHRNSAPCGGNKSGTISRNTAATYFSIFKAALKQAFIDEYLTVDLSAKIKGIQEQESRREYLTVEELNTLADTPCEREVLKRAALFYRSGSVKQELTGTSLNEFLLKRSGLTWDEVTEPRATFADIDEKAFKAYLVMAREKGRLPDVEGLTIEEIFDKLRLTKNGELTRAAIILFGKDPRRFSTNAFVKIGRFKGDADLRFQDVEEGNLIVLLKNVLERLDHKYLTRSIEFKGMLRLEHSEYPIPALREMLLNALVHRTYMGSFTQIRVYDDKITIWNHGTLPEEITQTRSFFLSAQSAYCRCLFQGWTY